MNSKDEEYLNFLKLLKEQESQKKDVKIEKTEIKIENKENDFLNDKYFNFYESNKNIQKLREDFKKEVTKSIYLEQIFRTIHSYFNSITENFQRLMFNLNKIKNNDYDTTLLNLKRIIDDEFKILMENIKSILLLNHEKDKNLTELFNISISKFMEFNDNNYKKGIYLILIENNKNQRPNTKYLTKQELLILLSNMDNKDSNNDTNNERSFTYIPPNYTKIDLEHYNQSIITDGVENEVLHLDTF